MKFHCQGHKGYLHLGSHGRWGDLAQVKHGWEGRNEIMRWAGLWQGRQVEGGKGRRSPLPPPLAPQPGCPVQSPAQQQVWRQQGAPLLSALWVGPVQIQPLIVCFRVRGKRFNMWVDNITGYWTIKTFFIILWATSFIKSVLEKKPHIWHQEPLTGKSRNELLIRLFFSIIKHCHFPWSQTKTYHFGYYSFYLLATLWCLQEILKWYFLPSGREEILRAPLGVGRRSRERAQRHRVLGPSGSDMHCISNDPKLKGHSNI